MNFRKFILRKRILIPLIILLMVLGFFIYMKIVLSTDIPKSLPNVNHQSEGDLTLKADILTNQWGDTMSVETGRLTVLENRLDTSGNLIEIGFQRIKSNNPEALAPIVFLAGGPGSPGTGVGQSSYFYLFKKLRDYADIILIDQRGTGSSIPNLRCRNKAAFPTDIVEDVQEKILKSLKEKCEECAKEFLDMGIRLEAYNSKESAADIEDIRIALAYNQVTLYGYSYGTSLAQIYIRDYEKYVSKAILAAPLSPDLVLKSPKLVQQQFEKMDSLMKLDPRISAYIPDFTKMMAEVHNALKLEPKFIQIPLMDAVDEGDGAVGSAIFQAISFFKPYWELTLTDDHFQMMISSRIGTDTWISNFPALYYKMHEGDFMDTGNWLRNFWRQKIPNALFFTVNGTTSYSQKAWDKAEKEGRETILSHFGISFGKYPDISEAFNIKPIPGLNEPVSGNTKLLIIGGELDGRTPPENVDKLVSRFPNSRRVRVQNTGHNNLMDEQIMHIIIDFLNDSLTTDVYIKREIEFINPVPYKYKMADTLISIIQDIGIEKAIDFYKEQKKLYGEVVAYIYNFGENELNTLAYTLMNNDQVSDAIRILEFNIEMFPNAYNLYNSLGEMHMDNKDTLQAMNNFKKAVDLNYFDPYSQALVSNLKNLGW